MGLNILPSIPCKVSKGMYTIKIIICPNTALLIIFEADCWTVSSKSDREKYDCPGNNCRPTIACKTASTIITAPSTIKPKSRAPRLIRFPLTPNIFMRIMAKSMANGITDATIKPARQFPRNNTNTKITIKAPSIRLLRTVWMALLTILVRSRKGSMIMPSGKVFLMSLIRSFTSWITWLLLAPLSIITIAPATSPSSL